MDMLTTGLLSLLGSLANFLTAVLNGLLLLVTSELTISLGYTVLVVLVLGGIATAVVWVSDWSLAKREERLLRRERKE